MTMLERSPLALRAETSRGLAMRLAIAVSAAYRGWRNRREFRRLGEMSDYELADVGLTRADLHLAMASPFDFDPTARLGVLAEARVEAMRKETEEAA
jgi:uncharacterized protein YjiS (DUF1127 family)